METKRLTRSKTDRFVGGVCGGLAKYFNIDPSIMRLLMVAFALLGGPGIIVYIVMWLVVPEEQ